MARSPTAMTEHHATSFRVVALDMGGTKLRAALVDAQGLILHRDEIATLAQQGPEAISSRCRIRP